MATSPSPATTDILLKHVGLCLEGNDTQGAVILLNCLLELDSAG